MHQDVWIIDDDNSIRWVLEKALSRAGIVCESYASADLMLQRLEYDQPAVVVSDIRMPGTDGMALLTKLQELAPELPVIIMTAHSDLDSAVNAFKRGAFEYLPKPFDINEAVGLISRALEHAIAKKPKAQPAPASPLTEIIGEAPAMQEVFKRIALAAPTEGEDIVADYAHTGLTLRRHPLAVLRPRLEARGLLTAARLRELPDGSTVRTWHLPRRKRSVSRVPKWRVRQPITSAASTIRCSTLSRQSVGVASSTSRRRGDAAARQHGP